MPTYHTDITDVWEGSMTLSPFWIEAVIGALIPTVLRFLSWGKMSKAQRLADPIDWASITITLSAQVLLAFVASSLTFPSGPVEAAALGYAAPDALLRIFSARGSNTSVQLGSGASESGQMGMMPPSRVSNMRRWWGI
jgi:hypothetical protein